MVSSATPSSLPADVNLAALARDLLQDLPPELQHVQPELLATQAAWLLGAAEHGVPRDEPVPAATQSIRRRLVSGLFSRLLAAWDGSPSAAPAIIGELRRLESVRAACRPRADQVFAAELADQGGLSLVVEVAHDMRS